MNFYYLEEGKLYQIWIHRGWPAPARESTWNLYTVGTIGLAGVREAVSVRVWKKNIDGESEQTQVREQKDQRQPCY